MEAPKSNEVLLICIDANASMGSRVDRHDQVLGPFGVDHINDAGRALHDLLDSKGICSATTFFQKPNYATWRNPRSKKGHQLDHFLIPQRDLPRISDAGIAKLTVDSDHDPLQLKLRVARNLSKQRDSKGSFINRSLLRDPEIASKFRGIVLKHLELRQEDLTYPALRDAVHASAKEVLSSSERRRPGWFSESQPTLMAAILDRNKAQLDFNRKCKPGEPKPHPEYEILRLSRKKVKLSVAAAKNSWMADKISGLGQGNKNPKAYWDCVNNIKHGLNGHSKSVSEQRFRNKSGEMCSDPVENAKTVRDHFQKVYNIKSELDPEVLSKIEQRPVRFEMDDPPTLEEMRKALRAAKKDKATGDSKTPVEFWQILAEDESTEHLFHEICVRVWETGECEEEWLSNRLKLLPKKGDLKNLDNWRGIMLIESPSKILSSIIANRIQEQILEPEGLEEQNGFMRQRGCCDGIFTVKMALQKRHEHGLSTWAVFVDLIKAFDSVPREGLFSVLKKMGIPPKMLKLIIRFHSDLVVKVKIGDEDVCFESTTGVKQGCTMAPLLFSIYFQAANEALLASFPDLTSLIFKTAKDFIFTGRKVVPGVTGMAFSFDKSLYADDKTKLCDSRENLHLSLQRIFAVFKKFGLSCHVGRDGSRSKTEAMYFPAPGLKYEDADTSPLQIDGGEVPFTQKFKLLGSMLAYNLKDDAEIDSRIKSAQGAFQSIRKQFFSAKGIKNAHKKTAYEGLVSQYFIIWVRILEPA